MKKVYPTLLLMLLSCILCGSLAAQPDIQRIEPPNWWTGFQNTELQLMVYGKGIAAAHVSTNYQGVRVTELTRTENNNYLFVKLHIDPKAQAGRVPLQFSVNGQEKVIQYELQQKNTAKTQVQGFSPADVVYLIMPDRFANGDPTNDNVAGMREKADRKAPFGRHGGDLKGIQQKLDYLKELGVTALWLNPVNENDMHKSSYHGYAFTDFYSVDKRLGGNEAYLSLIKAAQAKGIKIIQDMVHNHIGSDHWWMADLPSADWIHQFPEFTRSNYRLATVSDPHASQADKDLMSKGWFDETMPDLNQKHPLLARYLIQNTLWWIAHAGIDGIRMDTYPYPDKDFMSRWCAEVLREFPSFNIVGEVWIHSAPMESYWLRNNKNRDGYVSHLPSITDFPLFEATSQAFNEPTGWGSGLARLYHVLAEDFLYEKPEENMIFLDNHDVSRFATIVGNDVAKYKMGLTFLMTTRGIPQLYYGAEIMMPGDGGFHPDVRKDFPGGWLGDSLNAFTSQGRNAVQNEVFNHLKQLANWRKTNEVIHKGKLTHFIPQDDTYVYFRHNHEKVVMVVLHTGKQKRQLSLQRFAELIGTHTKAFSVIESKEITLGNILEIAPMSSIVLELRR